MTTQKKILQEYLNEGFDYSHRIDVEPTPYYPVKQDELNQIMRTILFRINKKYLRSKYFPKWKPADKFWIVGCRQGGKNKNSETHYHLLLHTPKNHRVDILEDLILGFSRNAGTNPYNGKRRKIWKKYKDECHFADEDLDAKCLINVAPVRNKKGAVKYNTRQLNHKLEGDDFFVIGISE